MSPSRLAAGALTLASLARVTHADPAKEIVVETPGERSIENKVLLGALAAGGVIAGGLGLYFHLDSRTASEEVSAGIFTGRAWTDERDALVERADSSRTRAAIGYSLGGALLLGAAITLIVTEPATERVVIRPRGLPTVAPVEGGALLGGAWRF